MIIYTQKVTKNALIYINEWEVSMLIDTHCHINMMVKNKFDQLLTQDDYLNAKKIVDEAYSNDVKLIINVGTSIIESINSINLARKFSGIYASIGIHPNDLTLNYKEDLNELKNILLKSSKDKIVAIGECGLDFHYPDYNLNKQKDAFKYQIDLALENNLALIVHSRDAYDETLEILNTFKDKNLRGTIHCFSYDLNFAKEAINLNFKLGIDAPITYPKNKNLVDIVQSLSLENIILETDAPFLPPQQIRGKQNHPLYLKSIAEFISKLKNISYDNVAEITTINAISLFDLEFNLNN